MPDAVSAEINLSITDSKAGWRTVRFGDVVRNVDSSVRNPLEQGIERFIGLEHLDPESLHIKRWGNIADGTSFTRRVKPGQVLFGKRRAYQRKAAVADFDGICSGDILIFEPKSDDLLPELLPFIVQSDGFFDHALGTSAGSLSPRTKWADMARYEFALPPKAEQLHILSLLKITDETINKYVQAYLNFEIYQITMTDALLSKGELRKLGELIDVKHGFAFKSEYFSEKGDDFPLLVTPGNFALDGGLYFNNNNKKYYKGDVPNGFILSPNDLVLVMTDLTPSARLLGNPALIEEGHTLLQNQRIGKIQLKDNSVDVDFLYFVFLGTNFKSKIKATSTGSTVSHTSPTSIKNIEIHVPTSDEQLRVSKLLKKVDTNRRAIRNHIKTLNLMKKQLLNNLLKPNS